MNRNRKTLIVFFLLAGIGVATFSLFAHPTLARDGQPITPPVTRPATDPISNPGPRITPPPATAPVTVPGNVAPYITTISLSNGKPGQAYSAQISALDIDSNELTLDAQNLPASLVVTNCQTTSFYNAALTKCDIVGVPAVQGKFSVTLVAQDEVNTTTKDITLKVR